jgi:phosphoribosylformylglycinamidine (FGAM) synthase-like enzyme
MASAEFDDEALEKRPTVQVGDPFLEKLLLEACLEAMRSGAIAGIQDMGAAGLTSSSCEMASRAGTGIELDLSLVPQREANMTAYEMLLSESQERMLIVAHAGREREVVDIFRKWELDAVVIGRVREGSNMRIVHNNEVVADIPVAALTDEAPLYQRPMKAPARFENVVDATSAVESALKVDTSHDQEIMDAASRIEPVSVREPDNLPESGLAVGGGIDVVQPAPPGAPAVSELQRDYNELLTRLVSSPSIASKQWVYRQYDHMVRTNTAVLPGADAAVIRIKETRRALAMTLDGNGLYCAVNPREGAKLVVAEAARNVVCVGARPIAVTNCLNFASPERPEVMWSFSEVIDGMAEACTALETPVVSGNVSFYNETEGRGILPTPVIGMVGLVDDARRVIQQGFKASGDMIALLGTTYDDLSVSRYAEVIEGRSVDDLIANGNVPSLDIKREKAVQLAALVAAEAGLLHSAHDLSDGGLAVALAESCFSSLNREAIGADIDLPGTLPVATRLFSESPSRILISFDQSVLGQLEEIAAKADAPLTLLGRVGGDSIRIAVDGEEVIDEWVEELERRWRGSIGEQLETEVMAAEAE